MDMDKEKFFIVTIYNHNVQKTPGVERYSSCGTKKREKDKNKNIVQPNKKKHDIPDFAYIFILNLTRT